MKTIYLHIGTPKTATTAIQIFCTENQNVLNEKGYDYPIFPHKYPHIRIQRNGHFLVGKVMNEQGKRDAQKEKEFLEQGFSMIEESFQSYDNVILSDENIWHATAFGKFDVWKSLKEFVDTHAYRLKVIVYLRRQDALATSWLNQQIQDGWNSYSKLKWNDYIKNPKGIVLNYYEHLENISAVIGKENIDVHVFEKNQFKGKGNTIQSDFMESVGIEMTDEFIISDERQNITLSLNTCEIKRLVNTLPDSDKETHFFVKKITEKYAGANHSDYSSEWFSTEERKEFLAQWEESNDKVAKEYLHKEQGPLFHTDIKEAEKWTPQNPYMYEDIVYFFGEMALSQQKAIVALKSDMKKLIEEKDKKQTEKINKLKEENKELKKQIKDLQQTTLLFRLKRKTKHILGKDKAE